MKRYLLTLVHNPKNESALFPQVFPLKDARSPDEVTVPMNTLCFCFVNANGNKAEELQESFLAIKFGQHGLTQISSSIHFEIENGGTLYFIGETKIIGGIECIVNPKLRTCVSTAFLGNNYEVIDM